MPLIINELIAQITAPQITQQPLAVSANDEQEQQTAELITINNEREERLSFD
ncbi:MAG: hypothetical protein V7784_07750 [Oceanospirillaceae bacterium]